MPPAQERLQHLVRHRLRDQIPLRLVTAVDVALLVLAALYACGSTNAFQYPKDLIREPALVLLLVPFVLARAGRSP